MDRLFALVLGWIAVLALPLAAQEVTLVADGQARCAIHVSAETMAADIAVPNTAPYAEREAEMHRRRLRESVRDLAFYLEKMSGAKVEILTLPVPGDDARLPILIGDRADQVYGGPKQSTPFRQGYRLVVSPTGIGMMGECGESASYAVYELLDRLGCRWYLPGELGESVPSRPTVALPAMDLVDLPSTPYRGIWYADDAYKRRNRLGGFNIAAGHALNSYISQEQREANPELCAETNGQRTIKGHFLCWGNPATAEAVAATIIAKLDANYVPSVSLSPADGVAFCECTKYCKPLDAGDYDPTMDTTSITDRYIVFCNRIATIVTAKYPEVQFGFLAYVQYTRPPVREKPHPNLVPEIAPITYCRAHAMTADNCTSRALLKPIVEGWNRSAKRFAYYNYMFHLAETAVPYPMVRQMTEELPLIYGGPAEVFWQPETITNFESCLPGMWISLRLAWDSRQSPDAVLDAFYRDFHGAAAEPMRRYWQIIDDAWHDVPEHSGCSWGYMRRFTPEVMQAARAAMNDALAAASTPLEYRRVSLFDDALHQFERFMKMKQDLANGNAAWLHVQTQEWMGTQIGLANRYQESYAFGRVGWSSLTNIAAGYFSAFNRNTYDDIGKRLGRGGTFQVVLPKPLREWRYQMVRKPQAEAAVGATEGEAQNWHRPDFDDSAWATTDVAVETWATLGHLGKYGTMWYRTSFKAPAIPAGKKVYLWIAATDGSAKVYVNGQHIPYTKADGTAADVATGYADPFTFDITAAFKPGAENHVAIAGIRLFINELGTGGLLGPVYLLRDK